MILIYKEQKQKKKQKILVADDSEMNRSILADMLEDEYEIIEAKNGVEAVSLLQKLGAEISLVLLDIVMPEMDGFGVLNVMNQRHWIEDIPVIMISAENAPAHVERAYELGITDFISRPFDALIVHHRVINTILLYAKQKKLIGLVEDQIYEKERNSSLMVDILSHIVEFRNGESGLHVLHVRTLTEMILQHLIQKTSQYQISPMDISTISTASALHDIGKIAIPESILNKPGKLTEEEFAVMKTHTTAGAKLLEDLPFHQDEPLIKLTYQICRWHHERYDGRGYPDGLKGDEIPIPAQVVALADVYDALTSVRCYKPAFTHEEAVAMILDGQCGTFNPLLLECLEEISNLVKTELTSDSPNRSKEREMRSFTLDLLRHDDLTASERTLRLLEHERMKYNFFAALTQEIQFEYTHLPAMVTLSAWGADKLGLPEIIMDPLEDEKVLALFCDGGLRGLAEALYHTTPEKPVVTYNTQLWVNGEKRWHRLTARATWSEDEPAQFSGAIGKAMDVHDSRMKLDALERMASHDPLTGLLNHAYAKTAILKRLEETPGGHFALSILDLDHFKSANDTYGHMFGDNVLKYMSERLRHSVRSGDIVARVGGDEFLIFLEYHTDAPLIIGRIYKSLLGQYEDFTISISMGVAKTETVGVDYEELFHAADQALYTVKRSGRGQFRFYDSTMSKMLSAISPIDGGEDGAAEKNKEEQL